MKAALAVQKQSFAWSLEKILSEIEATTAAAAERADLILFAELAATPGDNNDDPEHDLPLGQAVPGEVTDRLGTLARRHQVYVGIGMLEREGNCLYDTAVLLGRDGDLGLKYRRIQPQWHGSKADPNVYRQGDEMPMASTEFGRLCFAICGDLFDDAIAARIRQISPDYVLWPIARNFSDGSFNQDKWDLEEDRNYVAAAAGTATTTLMVNRLVDPASSDWPSFGGALAVSKKGQVIARWPLAKPGILYIQV